MEAVLITEALENCGKLWGFVTKQHVVDCHLRYSWGNFSQKHKYKFMNLESLAEKKQQRDVNNKMPSKLI